MAGRIKIYVSWLCGHAVAVAMFVGGMALWLLTMGGRRSVTALERGAIEQDAVNAKRDVALAAAEKGQAAAHAHVDQMYAEARSRLSVQQRAQAQRLRDNPAEMAAYLVRAASAPVAGGGPGPDTAGPSA